MIIFFFNREKAFKELEEFRQNCKYNEERLIEFHRNEIVGLNQKLEELKQQLCEQSNEFEFIYTKFEKEKNLLSESIRVKNLEEIEKFEEKYAKKEDTLKKEKQKLVEKFHSEISRLKNELEENVTKSNKEKQEYENNLIKLKAFHEHELDACRQNSNNEYVKLIEVLKTNIESLRKQKIIDENELIQKYNKKQDELAIKEEEIKSLNEMMLDYKKKLESSSNDIKFINQKVK